MKRNWFMMIVCIMVMAAAAYGQMIPRTDVKWARNSPTPITLDGVLNEPAWAVAESVNVVYGQSAGMPGSGWFDESAIARTPSDPTRATVKFLAYNDSLYVAFIVKDQSVGGGLFNRFDGILANIRRKDDPNRPVRDGEIFYAWCSESWADTQATLPGRLPAFLGGLAGSDPYHPRSDSLRNIWDAATTVQGVQNNDAVLDQGYTVEMKINLRARNYNVTQPTGDIAMYSFSIYDADWQWPVDSTRQTDNRVWYQCPWGNTNAYNHIRLYVRPDVTTSSGPVPVVGPEIVIPAAGNYPSPVIDGNLTEGVWQNANIGSLQIKYGDANIRNSYPSTAPYRSGQFQPTVNGGLAAVTDPNLATVKYFFKADTLFLGFDVNDRVVQYIADDPLDRWDGFRVVICDRNALNGDNVLFPRQLTFRVQGEGTTGSAKREEDLAPISGRWDSAGTKVQVALALKPGTTVDTIGATADVGYTAEMKVILPQIGYPAGRGDGILFLGITHFDGDSFTPPSTSYGTRTWFMREGSFNDGAAWAYMDPSNVLAVPIAGNGLPREFAVLDNYPNPFNPTTQIQYDMPEQATISLKVYNILGQEVMSLANGVQPAGHHTATWDGRNNFGSQVSTGVYFYRFEATGVSGQTFATLKKMILMK